MKGDLDLGLPMSALWERQADELSRNRVPVAVVGTRNPTQVQSEAAEEIGRLLARHRVTVLCGGRAGVMEDVCRGVAAEGGSLSGCYPITRLRPPILMLRSPSPLASEWRATH